MKKNGVQRNVFYKKDHMRNGKMEGVQSFANEKTYTCLYDEATQDMKYVWIKTPEFIRKGVHT